MDRTAGQPGPSEIVQAMASRRAELGLSTDQLGELVGLRGAAIEAIEAGTVALTMTADNTISGVLGLPGIFRRLTTADPLVEMDTHAAELGCWSDAAELLRWARRVYTLDARITQGVENVPPLRTDLDPVAIAAAVPAPAITAFSAPTLEGPTRRPAADRRFWWDENSADIDYRADGTALATLLRDHLGHGHDTPADPEKLLADLGVAVAAAPADPGSWTKAVLLHLAGTALVVTNSRMNPVVTRHSLAHLLGHLAARDVHGPGVTDLVEDQDDDSIFHCTGASADTCRRADAFAAEILVPAAWLHDALAGYFADSLKTSPRQSDGALEAVRSWVWEIQRLAGRAGVDTHLVFDQIASAGLPDAGVRFTDAERAAVELVLRRRSPFAGTARNGAPDAVESEDLALRPGDGLHRLPARLRERAALASEHEGYFGVPVELRADAGTTPAQLARLEELDAERMRKLGIDDDLEGLLR